MSFEVEIQLIAVLVSVASSLVGVFLVLRRMSMATDSITHTILLGIVLAFFLVHDLNSPFLIIGAAVMGVATVWLTEMLGKTKLVSEDASIGIVFPLLFSIAVLLISKYAGNVHLDIDSVMLGELAFAPFERLRIGSVDIGAKAIYSSGALVLLNLVFIIVFFKELKIVSFDPLLAAVLGFMPSVMHYCLMFLVSITAVGSFQAVGSILVVAFMIGPPVTAYLVTDSLKRMVLYSCLIGAFNAIVGYQISALLDVSIAGMMAVVTGITFLLVFIFQPKRGLLRSLYRKQLRTREKNRMAMVVHIAHHAGSDVEDREAMLVSLHKHFQWDEVLIQRIFVSLRNDGLLEIDHAGLIRLTSSGWEYAESLYS